MSRQSMLLLYPTALHVYDESDESGMFFSLGDESVSTSPTEGYNNARKTEIALLFNRCPRFETAKNYIVVASGGGPTEVCG